MGTANDANGRHGWLSWIDRVSMGLAVLGGVVTMVMMLNIVLDVSGRFLFNSPLQGTLDLSQYAWMPSLVAMGLAYALLKGEHIRVSLLTSPTGERTQRVVEILSMGFSFFIVLMLAWFSAEKAMQTMGFGEKAAAVPWLAIWPYRWVVLLGLIALLLQILACLVRAITAERFHPVDENEGAVALEAEETVFDELSGQRRLQHGDDQSSERKVVS